MAVQISGNDITVPRDTTVTRNLTVGGVLTYEDVTNVDSVGLVTARSGIEIGARPGVGASISVDGNAIFSGITTVGGDIKVGSSITLSPDGDVFATGISTFGDNVIVNGGNLTVKQPAGTEAKISINEATTTNSFTIKQTSSEARIQTNASQALNIRAQAGSGSTSYLAFWTRDTEKLRIDSNGRILIGHATTPTAVASIAVVGSYGASSTNTPFVYICRDEAATAISGGESLGQILFASNDGYRGSVIEAVAEGAWSGSSSDGYLLFKTTPANATVPSERMRIGSNGQVTLKPNSNLNEVIRIAPGVDASDTQEYGISWASNAAHTHPVTKITTLEYDASDSRGHLLFYTRSSNTDSAPTERMRIAHDGTVNIPGGVDGSGLLHVGQNTSSYVRVEDLGVETYGIVIRKAVSSTYAALRLVNTNGHKGNLNVSNSGVALANASDYRLKENEITISDGITRVKQLIPRRFNFKTDSTTVDGFFAHEVSPVVPESVFGEKDATINEEGDGYQMLDQSKLIPVLTASIKELIAKVETLEAEVAALKSN